MKNDSPLAEFTFFKAAEHEPFVMGPGVAGGPGALLIHGFPGTPSEMRPLGQALAGAGWTAHGMLLPGFGQDITRLGETGREVWLRAASRVWEEVHHRYRPALLVGYSLGGAIALHLAAALRPDHLVLLAPFWGMDDWRMQILPLLKILIPTIAPFEEMDLSDPQVRTWLSELMPQLDINDPVVQQALREQIQIPTSLIAGVRRLALAAYRLAPRVEAPTLILQGFHDDVVDRAKTRQLLARLGGPVAYRELPGGHQFPVEANGSQAPYIQLLLDYLGRPIV